MVDVITPNYKGPERRATVIVEQCACHLKHDAVLKQHTSEIKDIKDLREAQHNDMWTDIKQKTPLKIFILAILIVAGAIGAQFLQTYNIGVKVAAQEATTQAMSKNIKDIQMSIWRLHDDLDDHVKEWKKTNGNNQKDKGD